MSENYLLDKQRELDIIQYWLSDTAEPFDDWDYNGEELVLLLKGNIIERYTKEEMANFMKGFK
ncbi:MAG: hypothetical protein JXA68_06885 [Ignavibacteriales bacterium]|nr:hypothetical protein [Ignavibacteriales bacterium]